MDAERFLTELEEKRRRQYASPTAIAMAAAALGDRERALAWTERAVVELDPNLQYMIRKPYFELLRPDPRYQDLLRRMNLE